MWKSMEKLENRKIRRKEDTNQPRYQETNIRKKITKKESKRMKDRQKDRK